MIKFSSKTFFPSIFLVVLLSFSLPLANVVFSCSFSLSFPSRGNFFQKTTTHPFSLKNILVCFLLVSCNFCFTLDPLEDNSNSSHQERDHFTKPFIETLEIYNDCIFYFVIFHHIII